MADSFAHSYDASQPNMVPYPLWLQAAGGDSAIVFAASDFRELIEATFPVDGPLLPTDFIMTQRGAGANFSVDISAGRGIVSGTDVPNQGKFSVKSTGVVNLTTPTAPVSGVTRHHRVVYEILDKQAAGSLYGWNFHLLEDTGGGSPPAPADSYTLGTVNIPVGAASVTNAMITNSSVQISGQPYYARAALNASYINTAGATRLAGANFVPVDDVNGLFTTSSGGSFFTIPVRGRWEFTHEIVWNGAPAASTVIACGPLLNSTTSNFLNVDSRLAMIGFANYTKVRDEAKFAAGDKIYFVTQAFNNDMTVAPSLASNPLTTSHMSIRYLSG